ncbi:MAG: hypothetical protein CL582_21900 [Alteromonadaceae bacterium]|nr:hypothetical protein [Alteromonadaceae bacterium]
MPYREPKKDYPISRFLTSPLGKGLGSAAVTGGAMLALRKGLRSKAARDIVKKRLGRELPSGPTNKRIAATAAFSGGFSGLFANLERDIYAKALNRKLESGRGGFTSQEKKLLVGKVGKGTGKVKGFSEYYVTPRTHALGRGALGLLFGGPSGALAEGISGGAGTAINRRLWARALLARSRGGEKLTLQEKRLLGKLRRGK